MMDTIPILHHQQVLLSSIAQINLLRNILCLVQVGGVQGHQPEETSVNYVEVKNQDPIFC